MQDDLKIIRIYNKCEGGIDKSVLRITVWHHKACRLMTKGDLEGQIFMIQQHFRVFAAHIKKV